MYLKSVDGVADVDVFDLLVEDEGESAGFLAVLFRQEKGVTFWREGRHLLVRAESKT
jgi:hypothetical protein